MNLRLALFALIAVVVATPANAAIYGMNGKTCMVGAAYYNPDKSHNIANAEGYSTCPAQEMTDHNGRFESARLEPGYASMPLDIYGICKYVDNNTQQSFFIPAGSQQEWAAFVNSAPGGVELTDCCIPTNIPASQATCGQEVAVGYGRSGSGSETLARDAADQLLGNAGRTVTFSCQGGQWRYTGTNGRPCDNSQANAEETEIQPGFIRATISSNGMATQQGYALQRNFTN
jgi:hypothetical protein